MDANRLEDEVRGKMRRHASLLHVPGKHAERAQLHAEIDIWLDRWNEVQTSTLPRKPPADTQSDARDLHRQEPGERHQATKAQ